MFVLAKPAVSQEAPRLTSQRGAALRDTVELPIALGLARLAPIVPLDFAIPPVGSRVLRRVAFRDWVEEWGAAALARLERDRLALGRGQVPPGEVVLAEADSMPRPTRDSLLFLPPLVVRDTAAGTPDLLGGIIGQHADLGMRVTGLGELGGSWTRYEPCDPSLYLNCNPGLFPQLKPNVEFGVQVAGTVSDRIHVNVDYDQRREDFSAANNINVFYQGLPDEILQRVEVGDVSLRLPRSNYLTRGVPAGNFGFMAAGQLGPIDFQAVWAQQRGDVSTREFRLAGGGTGGLVQDDRIVLDDADYVKGQFFFLVHPDSLASSPHVDVVALRATDAPATQRPEPGGTIEIYRDERIAATNPQQQAQLGIFLADAFSADGTLRHTGQFRRLTPDQDYLVHNSGLWIVLRSPLRSDESLAISYVTEAGDTIGTMNAERVPPGTTPRLRLLRSPVASHQPGRPTWDFEMHQVYRLTGSSDVELSSIDLRISLGDAAGGLTFKESNAQQVPFLRLFGLDEDAPVDAVDFAQIYQPARDDFGGGQPGARIGGTYVVFPTLEPFLTPPPVPSANLTAAEARALLAGDANAVIYQNPDPIAREGGGQFRLNFGYRVKVDGLVSSFSLGQFGIREGTERIQIGDRTLERGVDYTMDYEIGTVTLTDAQTLFAANPGAEIRATFEQQSLFDIAPTSVFGAAATYRLGARGALNFVGMYQAEKTLYTRPQLGVEPGAAFLGGASANLNLGGAWLDRAFEGIPFLRAGGPSVVRLDAEVAFSLPDPNRRNAAYLDDFEGGNETTVDVRRQQWRLGSAPQSHSGDDGSFPVVFDATTATRFVWQHDISSNGVISGSLLPQRDLDRQINVAGTQTPEPAMWLTFGDREPAGDRRWRSITTVLSTTGLDMTRSEFLEFYVSAGGDKPLALVFDIGAVSEDAMFLDSLGNTSGTTNDGRAWGLGVLDEEARVTEREIWGPDKDARGLWNQNCTVEPLTAYPFGDVRSNCTRGNGVLDTEDLDGNGIPDFTDGAHFRYIVKLTGPSPYMVRDTGATGTGYRLYRIPLRDAAAIPVNGASDGTWRFIRHLRMTVIGEPIGDRRNISIARVRIIGSRWTKRDVHGIKRGLVSGEDGLGAGATLTVGPVSRVTDGASYTSPPGVLEELQDPSSQFGAAGIEFNEKSLRVKYQDLEPDERGELYFRYPQSPQNFMTYRQLRFWALARDGDWGAGGTQRLVVKAGTDPRNFYLFQTRLRTATGTRPVTQADWQPEIVIDFQPWFELKARAEERLIQTGQLLGQDTLWSADSTYAIVLEDRARAPNLAAIRELTFAVFNEGPAPASGEVWINDLRLLAAQRDPGMAGNVSLTLDNEFMSVTATYANRGSFFRQLDDEPTYQASGDLRVTTRTRLDRFLPGGWGLEMPVVVEHTSSALDPRFLERTDVLAQRLDGLRETGGGLTRVGVQLRKTTPSSNPLLGLVMDGMTLRFGYNSGGTNSITSRAEAKGVEAGADYRHELERRDVPAVPGFVQAALRALAPAPLENSQAFQDLLGARFRWSPRTFGFNTSYTDQQSRSYRFDRILALPADSAVQPIESPRKGLENGIDIGLQPFDPITASVSVRSSRDLLEPERASTQPAEQQALERARARLAGTDIGWETRRSLGTNVTIRPAITNWFRPSYTYSNRFSTDRNPSYLERLADSTAVLQRRFGSDRQITRRLDFQPSRLFAGAFAGADSAGGVGGALYDFAQSFQTLNFVWNSGRNSVFERETSAPGTRYQFGFGDFDSFRILGGDTSVTAVDRDDFRVSSGIGLPAQGLLTLGFQRTRLEGLDVRGGRRNERQVTWPSVRLGWRQIPVPSAISGILLAASASAGYEHAERSNELGGRNAIFRGSDERRYPLELSLTFAHGFTTTYTGTLVRGTSQDPTGDAENDGANHSFMLTGVIQPPEFLKPRISNPIQTQLTFTQDDQRRCRFRPLSAGLEECISFVDTSVRTLNLTMDTRLSDLSVGFRLGYTSRQNHVGTRTGSNQFQLGLFGQFNFSAGQMPTLGNPVR